MTNKFFFDRVRCSSEMMNSFEIFSHPTKRDMMKFFIGWWIMKSICGGEILMFKKNYQRCPKREECWIFCQKLWSMQMDAYRYLGDPSREIYEDVSMTTNLARQRNIFFVFFFGRSLGREILIIFTNLYQIPRGQFKQVLSKI